MVIIRIVLIMLTLFLGITGCLGGIGLLAGWNTPPLSILDGSIFKDYTIPAISLLLFVGGGGVLASALLLRRNRFATVVSIGAGIIIMVFEFVEVLSIGSPAGIARTLQVFYFGLGLAIATVAMAGQFMEIAGKPTGVKGNHFW